MAQGFKFGGFLWIILFVALALVYTSMNTNAPGSPKEIPFSEFRQQVEAGQIKSVTVVPQEGKITGQRENAPEVYAWLAAMPDEKMLEFLDKAHVPYSAKKPDDRLWRELVLSVVPVLLIIFTFAYMIYRQMQGPGKSALSFGKSRAKMFMEKDSKITFEDVAGCEESKRELQEVIEFLKDPKKFTKLGGKIPKGVLLVGPPGTGKTLLARAVAGEAAVPFFSISGSDFVEMFVGVGASRVRDLFEQGKKNAPCIIFIDEIDAVGRHRGAGLGGGHDEREQTLNALLVEMDGFETKEGVIIIAATNRPDVLDSALLRPGRFDRRIIVDLPDVKGRTGILQVHTKKIPLSGDVDLLLVAKGAPGFTGAELANLVNEAALLAARRDKQKVSMIEFDEAKDKVLMGPERKSLVLSEADKNVTAYHEAGHALVAHFMPAASPLHKISIIPRGRALGVTQQLPDEDKYMHPKSYWLAEVSVCLGGRIAEEIVLKDVSIGAANDLERATNISRKMVCEWGMSENLGLISYGQRNENVFLGRDFAWHTEYSDETAKKIDEDVRSIIHESYVRARRVIEEHRPTLDRLAAALLRYEVLDAEQIKVIMSGVSLEEPEESEGEPSFFRVRSVKEDSRLRLTVHAPKIAPALFDPGSGIDADFKAAIRKAMREMHAFIAAAEGRYRITLQAAAESDRQSLARHICDRYGFPAEKIETAMIDADANGAACHILVELVPVAVSPSSV